MTGDEQAADVDAQLSRTQRIDIHPDFLGESLERKKRNTQIFHRDALGPQLAGDDERTGLSQEFTNLFQGIYDAALITDYSGKVQLFNQRAKDFFLCESSELRGVSVIDLMSGADESILRSVLSNLEDHRYTLIDAVCVRKDKSSFPAEIAVNKMDMNGSERLCFFVRDTTVRKMAQEALEKAVARLEAHDRSRSQFVSNVSHELRTPLTSMIYAVHNMLRGVVGPLPDRVRYYMEMLEGDCKRLLATVNDILDLRKIETNTLTLSRSKTPLARLVRRACESLKVLAEQKGLELQIVTNGRWFVNCDPLKMERVILNVVGNAIKFTPQGGGGVTVAVQDYPNWAGHVLLSVQDTGIGIPPDAIDRVMERYFTVGEQPSGSGLGLAISKEIVQLHGGSIEIQSPPPEAEKGTIVYIAMPLVTAPTLLIVEDEPGVLEILSEQMTSQGYQVVGAANGREALEKVQAGKPDALILDLGLPEMDGTEVILKLKSEKSFMRIPIIVVTAGNVGRARAHILNSFSIPALSKPWQEADLLDKLEGAFLGMAALV